MSRVLTAIVLVLALAGTVVAQDAKIKELEDRLGRTEARLAQLQQGAAPVETEWSPLQLKADYLLMTFTQEGGVVDSANNPVSVGYDPSLRVELGTMCKNTGLGIRGRWTTFNNDGVGDFDNYLRVDAEVGDLEIFKAIQLTSAASVELSVGLRRLSYEQEASTVLAGSQTVRLDFMGTGGTLAFGARHRLGPGALYANARLSILSGDIDLEDFDGGNEETYAKDTQVTQIELGFGYEAVIPVGSAKLGLSAGIEWQTWSNLGFADDDIDTNSSSEDDVLEDVGFYGFKVGATLKF